jgi:tetratricopeptide (TPR) repeat protein
VLNKLNINPRKQKLIVYIALTVITLAVFWQVNRYDFINIDDNIYVTGNNHIQSGITLDGIRWAFSSTYAEFWHPLTWLSLMFDYQLHGLNAGGYHLTNLILHILSTLLLFWLFNRMTGTIWRSAFIAAFFALHPLHVESVVWIAERKDVLSVFFWMLTLCLYVYYTEKPVIKRYLPVVFFFACGLMSKPLVVTLPVIMILLDYWPLGRFASRKSDLMLWQLREKIPFFILSAVFSMVTLYAQHKPSQEYLPLGSRLANDPVSFMIYLEKTFVPNHMAVFYPFSFQLPAWQVWGSVFLLLFISVVVIMPMRRLPYLFTGWLWYVITLLPVSGIIQARNFSMADRYTYLPLIGIAVMLAWGIPPLIKNEDMRKKILFPASVAALAIMAVLTWHQCGYWKNSIEICNHALQVTKDNYLAHINLGSALFDEGKTEEAIAHYSEAIRIMPDIILSYNKRGIAYDKLGRHQRALEDFNKAISLKPDDAISYNCRGNAYAELGQYQMAIEDYNKTIRLKPDNADAYISRGTIYTKLGQYQMAIEDLNNAIRLRPDNAAAYNSRGAIFIKFGQYQMAIEDYNKTIRLKPDDADVYNNRGTIYTKLGQYQMAIEDFNNAIRLKPDDADTYFNRGIIYFTQGNNKSGCFDAQKACALGNCKILEVAKTKGLCH